MEENEDRDLLIIQQVRDSNKSSKISSKEFATFSQERIDRVVEAISMEIRKHSEKLAKMANEETGFGKWQDKTIKKINLLQNFYTII